MRARPRPASRLRDARRSLLLPAAMAALASASPQARALVIRADVADDAYRAAAEAFPALVDLPGEGHGVLIARRWAVSAAHPTLGYPLDHVVIRGVRRAVKRVVVHPAFHAVPAGAQSGDAAPMMAALAGMDDIALIELSGPVDDAAPVALHRRDDELGRVVTLFGKGATGDGRSGQSAGSAHRGALRRAENTITRADGRWLDYRFDCAAGARPLEGVMGDGDSGGPVLLRIDGDWKLAGLASWKHWQGDLAAFRAGVCGQVFSNVRISHYAEWIDGVIRAAAPPPSETHRD